VSINTVIRFEIEILLVKSILMNKKRLFFRRNCQLFCLCHAIDLRVTKKILNRLLPYYHILIWFKIEILLVKPLPMNKKRLFFRRNLSILSSLSRFNCGNCCCRGIRIATQVFEFYRIVRFKPNQLEY